LILIDTAGFRHGDPQLKMQLESLSMLRQIKTYLVMSSNSQAQMLKASVHAYGVANLQGCVLTKLDETASLGEAMGVVMQSGLPVAYTTDGQDIPKHIEVAKAHQLVAKAVSLLKSNSVSILSSH
jgi:flagellar biosynthesis protein FlhF